MLTKKIGPQWTIPLMAVSWSIVCTLTGIIQVRLFRYVKFTSNNHIELRRADSGSLVSWFN